MSNTRLERFKPFASVHLVKLSFPVSSLWFGISVPLPPQPFVSFLCCRGFDPCSWIPTWRLVYGHLPGNVHLWRTHYPYGSQTSGCTWIPVYFIRRLQGPRPHPVFYYQFRLLNVPEKYKLFVTKMGCGVCCDPCFSCLEVFHNWPFKSEKLI